VLAIVWSHRTLARAESCRLSPRVTPILSSSIHGLNTWTATNF